MQNRTISIIPLAIAALAILSSGCAKESKLSSSETTKAYFDAWMNSNYPGISPTGRGSYIVSDTPGTGDAISADDKYIRVSVDTRDMDGNYASTTNVKIAQQTGSYSPSTFYGSAIWSIESGNLFAGLIDGIKGMRVGGSRTLISPSWLNRYDDYDTENDYLKKYSSEDCAETGIYDITLLETIQDIKKYQVDSIERYMARNLVTKDSTFYGYYYIQTQEPDVSDAFPVDTVLYIDYIGRLLNGQVFDTTIEDTAKFYNIYSASTTYEPVQVNWGSSLEEITLGEESSSGSSSSGYSSESSTSGGLIRGFAYCLYNMRSHEKGTCVFISNYGYTYNGSGKTIPPYSPLRFDIELVDVDSQ